MAVYLSDKSASVTVIGRSETVLQEVMGQKVGRRVQKVETFDIFVIFSHFFFKIAKSHFVVSFDPKRQKLGCSQKHHAV